MLAMLLASMLMQTQAVSDCDRSGLTEVEASVCILAETTPGSHSASGLLEEDTVSASSKTSFFDEVWGRLSPEQRQELSADQAEFITAVLAFEQSKHDVYIKAYQRQAKQSWFVFAMVLFIVGSGLLFAGYQLWISMQIARKQASGEWVGARATSGDEGADGDATQIGFGDATIKTASAGLAVLFISLAFFYLMLEHVYQLDDPTLSKPPTPAVTQAQ
jgi:hypothetical protein